MRWTSYAQNQEDVVLMRVLSDVQQGFWIDVGAQDPRLDSVTCAFSERGWRGVNIEPVPVWHAALAAARPRDVNLAIAVGEAESRVPFHEVDGSGLSTMDARLADRHRAEGHVVRTYPVQVRTLASVCAEHVRGPVHFLKIDAEGAERAVLAGMDFQAVRPWIVVVEATEPDSRVPTHAAWEPILLVADYAFAYADGINRFYLAREHAARASRFGPPTVLDNAIRREHVDEVALVSGRLAAVEAELQRHASLVAQKDADLAVLQRRSHDDAEAATARLLAAGEREAGLVAEVDRLHRAAADLQSGLDRTRAALALAEATLAQAQAMLAQSEAARSAAQAALAQSDAARSAAQAALAQSEAARSAAQAMVVQSEAARSAAQASSDRDRARADAADAAQVAMIRRLEVAERELARIASRVPDLQAQLRASAAAHAAAQAELLRHVGIIEGIRAEQAEVLASRSWRLTAPLRHANHLAARARARLGRGLRRPAAPAAGGTQDARPAMPPALTEDAEHIRRHAPVDVPGQD